MRTFPEMVRCGATDFGRHILPALPRSAYRAFAYDFARNKVPGVRDYEALAYWRAVGTPEALAEARRDVAGSRPRLNLRNPAWPIRRDLVRTLDWGTALDLATMEGSIFVSGGEANQGELR